MGLFYGCMEGSVIWWHFGARAVNFDGVKMTALRGLSSRW
jgi:hypothetical protein